MDQITRLAVQLKWPKNSSSWMNSISFGIMAGARSRVVSEGRTARVAGDQPPSECTGDVAF